MIKTLIRRFVGYDELLDRIKQTDERVAYLRDDCYDEFERRGGPPKWLIGRRISVAELNANAIKAMPIQTPLPNVKAVKATRTDWPPPPKLEWVESGEDYIAVSGLGPRFVVKPCSTYPEHYVVSAPFPSLTSYPNLQEALNKAQEDFDLLWKHRQRQEFARHYQANREKRPMKVEPTT